MKPPKFFISILCLNRIELTKQCIESVLMNSGDDYEVMITDNASTDGTKEYIEKLVGEFNNISFVRNDENKGFIEPMNEAFRTASRKGSTYFVCLNNDTIVTPGWLDALAKPLDENYKAALSGPANGCNGLDNNCMGMRSPITEYLEGFCLMVKVRVIEKQFNGQLFSGYLQFAYGEDSDLSLRVREKGYSIHKLPFEVSHCDQAGTVHRESGLKEKMRDIFENNHRVLTRRWAGYLRKRSF